MTQEDVSTPRILIVDDEPHILLLLSEQLDGEGYDITTQENGSAALELLAENEYDLVLVDLRINTMDGLEVMRAAKEASPDTIVIMLTGNASLDSAVEAMRHGAFDYLTKPWKPEELKERITKGLAKRNTDVQEKRLAEQALQFARAVVGNANISGNMTSAGAESSAFSVTPARAASQPSGGVDPEIVRVNDVQVDIQKHEVRRDDQVLNLTPTEFDLLVTLMTNPGRVLSCKYLVKQVHKYDCSEFEARSMIRVHIKHLRHKIERDPDRPEYILNVRGLGYKFGA